MLRRVAATDMRESSGTPLVMVSWSDCVCSVTPVLVVVLAITRTGVAFVPDCTTI